MKKKNLILLIILILIFGTTNVLALNIDSYWLTTSTSGWSTDTGSTYSTTFTNISGSLYKELEPQNINLSGNDYLQVNATLFLTNTIDSSLINLNNINFSETCSQQAHVNGDVYIVHYADGSTATITQNAWSSVCYNHNISGSVGGSESYNIRTDSILNVGIMMSKDNRVNVFWCTNTGGSSYTCPIPSGWTFSQLSFFGNFGGSAGNYKVMVARNMYMYKSDVQTIINNNNQNTTTINNSIQDTKDTITDSNINGNTSNDTITSIGNTFGNENDFLLNLLTIPYTLWTSLLNIFSNQCSPINVGTMFDVPLVFPCINLNSLLGNMWTTIIDVIFAGIIVSAFLRRVVKYLRELLSLDKKAIETGGINLW